VKCPSLHKPRQGSEMKAAGAKVQKISEQIKLY